MIKKLLPGEAHEIYKRNNDSRFAESLEAICSDKKGLADDVGDIAYRFAGTGVIDLEQGLEEMGEISQRYGIHKYTGDLLLIIFSLPHLHAKYREKGIPDSVFYESMDDVRCKTEECVECFGVVGTFVAGWYDGFFDTNRFAYGRFQYEPVIYDGEPILLAGGAVLEKGQTFINFHIPKNGTPLSDEVRLDSYRQAYPHYADLFRDGKVIFGCDSWLLYPEHRGFLPADSNILRFMDDFDVICGRDSAEFYDKWRVFGRYSDLPADKLPRDTSLRKAYADRLALGGKTGAGFGVFAFDGEKIIR